MRSKKKVSRRRSAGPASVDVHCHVFNAWDLPIRRFIELVYLEKYPGLSVLNPLIDFIEFIMRYSGAPTTGKEIAYLKRSGLTPKRLKPRGTRAHNISAVSRALTLMWWHSPKDRQWVRQHLRPSLQRRFKGTRADFREAAQHLMMGAGDITTWINFALIYTRWRWEITHELASLSKAQAADIFLYTPAILDIGTRLYEYSTSDLREQVEVMRLISKIKGRSYAVHAFVAFDPFRAAVFGTDVLAVVQDAVLNQGAIGVKIYPPMGIKPCNNNVGPYRDALNQQMKQFLGFCLEEDVPILAHCSFSQYVSLHPEDGACAAPEAWQAFLQQPGHENLRLDLGHCGGPWDFAPNCQTNTIWTQTVIELLGSGIYRNLYADVSDDSWILHPNSADNKKLMCILRGFLQANPKAKARLLYGSDWSLLARETGANNYYACMKKHFCKGLKFTPAECRGYLGGNALCFLGLVKNPDGTKPKNRVRLENFRKSNKLDMSIFSKIDALRPCASTTQTLNNSNDTSIPAYYPREGGEPEEIKGGMLRGCLPFPAAHSS